MSRIPNGALLTWTDESGQTVSQPKRAFYQHVFGPSIPAYTVRSPKRPGSYRLVVLDRDNRPQVVKQYQVISNVTVSQPNFPARRPGVTVHSTVLEPAQSRADRSSILFTLDNTSTHYIQSQVFREHVAFVSQTHPGLRSQWAGANAGAMVLRFEPAASNTLESELARQISLPEDLSSGETSARCDSHRSAAVRLVENAIAGRADGRRRRQVGGVARTSGSQAVDRPTSDGGRPEPVKGCRSPTIIAGRTSRHNKSTIFIIDGPIAWHA